MARRSMPYHRRYHGDALTGTMNLSLEERGAYATILDLIYDEGGPIIGDRRWLSGFLGCSMRKVDVLLSSLIEKGKLYETRDKKLSNRRAEKELQYAVDLSRINAEKRMKRKPKDADRTENRNENNLPAELQLYRGSIIPEPEPYIIDSSAYDAPGATPADIPDQAAADRLPMRGETFTRETAAYRLVRAGTAVEPMEPSRGHQLVDMLDRRGARMPVPRRGLMPTR